jgi:hypothetical protein
VRSSDIEKLEISSTMVLAVENTSRRNNKRRPLVERLGRKLTETLSGLKLTETLSGLKLTETLSADAALRWWEKSGELAARLGQELRVCPACVRPPPKSRPEAGRGRQMVGKGEARKGEV